MPPLTGFSNKGFTDTNSDPRQAMSAQMNQQQQKKPWWTALISELGGAGGAAGGVATGAAIGSVVPGLGTAVGGLIGGAAGAFLGGTGGRLAENKIRDNKFNVGSALGEGATDAVFSGLSGANDIRKGLNATKALGSIARVADTPATIISKSAKGIPIKYVPSTATGTGTSTVSKNLLVNPTVGNLQDSYNKLLQQGYKVGSKTTDIPSTNTIRIKNPVKGINITEPSSNRIIVAKQAPTIMKTSQNAPTPSVLLSGKKTSVPLTQLDAGNPQTLLAKPQAVTNTVVPAISGDLSSVLQAPEKVGLLQSVGKSLKAGASGYGIGAGGTANQLDANASDAIGNTLKTLKIPATAPETQARMLGNHIDNMGNLLSAQYAKANVPIARTDINHLGANIISTVTNTAGLGKGAENFALEQAQKLSKAKDVNEVWQFTKDLARNATNFGANPDSKLVDKEAAARIILDQTRGFLNGKVPGVAATNDLYHQAKTAESFVLDAAKDKGGGLIQRLASSAPAKTLEAKGGALLEGVGKATSGTGGPLTQLTHQGVVQTPANLLHGFTDARQTAQAPQGGPQALLGNGQPQDATASLLGQANGGGDATASLLGQPQQQSAQSGPSLASLQQAIQQDIQSTGGKNINNLMQLGQLYGIVDSSGNPVTTGGNGITVGKVSAQQNALAKSARTSLGQLAQLIQQDPTIIEKNATPGQGTPLIGSLVSSAAGASNYHALADNVLSSLIHLQTGATATKEEVTAAHGQLPQPGDPPEVQQRKLQTLLSNFAPFLGNN